MRADRIARSTLRLRRASPGIGGLVALAAVTACLLLPVGAMAVRSFEVEEVVTTDGDVFVSAGEVRRVRTGDRESVQFSLQDAPADPRRPVELDAGKVREVRTRWSLHHYAYASGDPRAIGLLRNSLLLALGAAVAALLLGLPLAWVLGRTDLPGRRVLGALDLGPAILPPFLVAMGVARPLGTWLHETFLLTGKTLQLVNAWVIFGFVLHPIVVLFVGRALAAVPAGPYEAALLARGRRAAARHVVLPAVLPAIAGACVLVFAVAIVDFGVPDILTFLLPPTGEGAHVFAREIQVQWANDGNHARAVATGAPLTVLVLVLLAIALPLLARRTLDSRGRRRRERVALRPLAKAGAFAVVLVVIAASLAFPLGGIVSWALGHGESVAAGSGASAAPVPAGPTGGRLLDFAAAMRNTPGVGEDWARWMRTGIATAVVATLIAVPLARWAARGGRLARVVVVGIGALSLTVPGLVIGVGTVLSTSWMRIPGLDDAGVRAVSALTARFLAFALLPAWLALREVPVGLEEAAAMLGAGPRQRAIRVWGPLASRGIVAGFLLVFLLALREIDAIVLIQPQVFPLRLYDKIHFSRLADEANLALFYVGHLLLPAVLLAVLLGRRSRRPSPLPERS